MALVVAGFLAIAAEAHATPTDAEAAEAKRYYGTASRAYDLAEYEEALRAFKEAYRLVGDPAFLFNIAQCHRKLGHRADAITFYKTYLRRAPNTTHRAEVEKFIADLDKGEAVRPEAAAPAQAPAAAPTAVASPQTAMPVALPPPSASAALVAAPAPPGTDRPIYKRPWFWVVTGAVLAGTVTAAVVLTRSDPVATAGPFSCPDCVATTPIGR